MSGHLPRLVLAALLAALFCLVALPATASEPPCEAAAEVEEILDAVTESTKDCGRTEDCWNKKRRLVEEALAAHPDNLFLHQRYQGLFNGFAAPPSVDLEAERDKLLAGYEQRAAAGDDPAALYLYGKLLDENEESAALYRRALDLDETFPWAHEGIARLAAHNDFGETAEGLAHVQRFVELCPGQVSKGLSFVANLDAPTELIVDYAARLRAHLAQEGEDAAYFGYATLWRSEFKALPPPQHDELRAQVRRDLALFEDLGKYDDKSWLMTVQQGYETLGDEEKLAALRAAMVKEDPCTDDAVRAVLKVWKEENRMPTGSDREEKKAWYVLRHGHSTKLVALCPDSFQVLTEHFSALTGQQEDASPEEVVRIGERLVALYPEAKGKGFARSPYSGVAAAWARDEVGFFDRLPELLEKDAEAIEENQKMMAAIAKGNEKLRERMEKSHFSNHWRGRWRNQTLLVRAWIGLDQLDDAMALLDELRLDLNGKMPAEDTEKDARLSYKSYDSKYWQLVGRLAAKEGRQLDAVAYYRRSHALDTDEETSQELAKGLWRELGGTDDGFASLTATTGEADEDEARWNVKDEAFADFELPDLSGKSWTLASFAGKKVFVNIWATWCGPCRLELPYVEQLHEKLRQEANEDILMVTFNMDFNPGVVAPYMKKNEYTFPVLMAIDYLQDQDVSGIPRNWVLDQVGRLRGEQVGFDTDQSSEEWMAEVMGELGKAGKEGG
jgi:thiol-disulfide isomerase/thioredoxin